MAKESLSESEQAHLDELKNQWDRMNRRDLKEIKEILDEVEQSNLMGEFLLLLFKENETF